MTASPRILWPLLCAGLLVSLACGGLLGDNGGTTTEYVSGSDGTHVNERVESDAPRAIVGDGPGCDPPHPTPAPQGCVMDRISCGDTIQGNNGAGEANFGNDFYVYHFCTPRRLGYDESPEAIYQITVPGDKKAIFHLESECAELDVMAMSWTDPSTCPTASGRRITECEMIPKTGSESVFVTTVTKAQDYTVVVDGRNGAEGNFTLRVECVDYR